MFSLVCLKAKTEEKLKINFPSSWAKAFFAHFEKKKRNQTEFKIQFLAIVLWSIMKVFANFHKQNSYLRLPIFWNWTNKKYGIQHDLQQSVRFFKSLHPTVQCSHWG